MNLKIIYIIAGTLFFVSLSYGQDIEQKIQHILDSTYHSNPQAVGFIVAVEMPDKNISLNLATGYSNRNTKEILLPTTPVLGASNIKPYVAATMLRLVERGKIKLGQPIHKFLKPNTGKLLENAGYYTDSITIKHLLSHTSGIRDYVDEAYFKFIDSHKNYEWTRDEQIERAAKAGAPLSRPGEIFRYADINYLLLTEIIENVTKRPYYKSIRTLLKFKKNHLDHTWFIKLENKPENTQPLAHQYWDEFSWDTYDLDPSWDLYGGGGIVATLNDYATFFQLLFQNKIVKDPDVLKMMYQDVPPNLEINYCLGIRKIHASDFLGYNHGGGLGTDVVYIPTLNATIAIAALEASHRKIVLQIRDRIIEQIGAIK